MKLIWVLFNDIPLTIRLNRTQLDYRPVWLSRIVLLWSRLSTIRLNQTVMLSRIRSFGVIAPWETKWPTHASVCEILQFRTKLGTGRQTDGQTGWQTDRLLHIDITDGQTDCLIDNTARQAGIQTCRLHDKNKYTLTLTATVINCICNSYKCILSVSKLSGSKADSGIPKISSVSPELMKALVYDKSLNPSDISVLIDPASGNHVISLRPQQQQQQQQPSSSGDYC